MDRLGHAEPHGTRRILDQRTKHRGQEAPLPFDLQCHPQRAVPREVQPRNTERHSSAGLYLRFRKGLRIYGINRYIQRNPTPYPVYREGRYLVGYLPSLPSAIAYAKAATEVFGQSFNAYNME